MVVPVEELLAVRAGVPDRTDPLREVGPVFLGLQLRLGVRIVIGDTCGRLWVLATSRSIGRAATGIERMLVRDRRAV